jgi:hypothetical protein
MELAWIAAQTDHAPSRPSRIDSLATLQVAGAETLFFVSAIPAATSLAAARELRERATAVQTRLDHLDETRVMVSQR